MRQLVRHIETTAPCYNAEMSEPAPKRRWLQFSLLDLLLLVLVAGLGIALAQSMYRHWDEPLTFDEAIEKMRERGESELTIQQSREDNGQWFEYTLSRRPIEE
jgi:hypothetical protein